MNTIGTLFRLTTFGESHGPAIGGVIDGCPADLSVDFEAIDAELIRRRGCSELGATSRQEPDAIEWLSGIYENKTLGTPIAFIIRNKDIKSNDYDVLRDHFRPGHGDYTWELKYGIRDHRGGGRCSARETTTRGVAGALAKQWLKQFSNIQISSTAVAAPLKDNTTVGGIVECQITGVSRGLGEPIFDKLQSQLASAMMSIPSATGFEFGEGFRAAQMTGDEYMDPWSRNIETSSHPTFSNIPDLITETNHCGGIMGGISNGMPIRFRVAFHPVITQPHPIPCADRNGETKELDLNGRHDRSHVQRASVIVESMAALILMDNLLRNRTQHFISEDLY